MTVGGPEAPIRISSLTTLAACPAAWYIRYMELFADEAGPSAHTGSAIARAIELWHSDPRLSEMAAAIEAAMAEAPGRYPMAAREDVARLAGAYAADPRNGLTADPPGMVILVEHPVRLTLPGWGSDAPIHLAGTLDQARWDPVSRCVRVWDVKSGGRERGGPGTLHHYTWQIAAYTAALACQAEDLWRTCAPLQDLGVRGPVDVQPGGVVYLQGYAQRAGARGRPETGEAPVFVRSPWSREQGLALLDTVRYMVSCVRRGDVPLTPGAHCLWCPAEGPPGCLEITT